MGLLDPFRDQIINPEVTGQQVIKAQAVIDGTGAIVNSFGFSTASRTATGRFTGNFDEDYSAPNYGFHISVEGGVSTNAYFERSVSRTVSSISMQLQWGNPITFANVNPSFITVTVFELYD